MKTLNDIFAENIRYFRKQAKLSQEELAYRSGLHRTYIGSIERGERNVSLKNIERIARALNINPTDLLQEHHGEQ